MSHGYVFVHLCYISRDDSYSLLGVVYTYRREAFALLVSTDRAMREPNRVKRAAEQVQVLTLFFFDNLIIDSIRLGEPTDTFDRE